MALPGLLRSLLGVQSPLPTTYGKCSLTTPCPRCTAIRPFATGWQPFSPRYFNTSRSISTQSSEALQQSPHGKARQTPRPSSKRDTKAKASGKSDKPEKPRKKEGWQIQKEALKKKFPEGFNPRKRLHPDTLNVIRHLHQQDPVKYSTPALSEEYKVSPEAIRRILKSKWQPDEETAAERRERWERRYKRIWNQWAEIGVRPHRPSFADLSDAKVLENKRSK
ncbi:hypothetical protein AJ79_04022 [Helicocarpus griseus UAMH5409]|uniref:Required for respiratory growth protein 9, mitochondrial n=1 Tax=Helicocarpus griseus UAMH5409 TaxID=1447875 RepID=A0A2B7XW69_9EURO|nr:hypothetical protein AJ79_04022 [Helicocarpus griseus UAMH5409]